MCSNRGHFAVYASVFVLAACCHLCVGLSFNGGVFTLQSTLSHPRLQTVSPSIFRSGWQIGDESCSQHGSHRERVQLALYLRHLMRDAQRGKKHKGGRDARQTGDRNLWREGHRKKKRRKEQEDKQLVFSDWLIKNPTCGRSKSENVNGDSENPTNP